MKLISRGVGIGSVRRLIDPVLQLGRAGAEVGLGQVPESHLRRATMVDEPPSVHTYQAHRGVTCWSQDQRVRPITRTRQSGVASRPELTVVRVMNRVFELHDGRIFGHRA